jgi:hypothetical protein
MKITIRRSCFETNSSSTHALTLGLGRLTTRLDSTLKKKVSKINDFEHFIDSNKVLTLGRGVYDDSSNGREEIITNSYIKADYCALELQDETDGLNDLSVILCRRLNLSDVIYEFTGEVDHVNGHNIIKELYANEFGAGLDRFIFNPNSKLIFHD